MMRSDRSDQTERMKAGNNNYNTEEKREIKSRILLFTVA